MCLQKTKIVEWQLVLGDITVGNYKNKFMNVCKNRLRIKTVSPTFLIGYNSGFTWV